MLHHVENLGFLFRRQFLLFKFDGLMKFMCKIAAGLLEQCNDTVRYVYFNNMQAYTLWFGVPAFGNPNLLIDNRTASFSLGCRQKEQAMSSYPRLSLGSHLRVFCFVFSSSDVGFWSAGRLGCIFRGQIECGLRFAGAGELSGRWSCSWRAEMARVVRDTVEAFAHFVKLQSARAIWKLLFPRN